MERAFTEGFPRSLCDEGGACSEGEAWGESGACSESGVCSEGGAWGEGGLSLRVLILSSWYPNTPNPVKGVFVREQARALRACGLEVGVVYPFDEEIPAGVVRRADEEGIVTWRANSLGGPLNSRQPFRRRWARLSSYHSALKLLRQAAGQFQPDILHAHVAYPAGILAYFFTRGRELPYVVTEHMSYLRDYTAKWQHRILLKAAFEKARLVIPVSPALAGQIESLGWNLNLRVLPNVVDTARFTPNGGRGAGEGSGRRGTDAEQDGVNPGHRGTDAEQGGAGSERRGTDPRQDEAAPGQDGADREGGTKEGIEGLRPLRLLFVGGMDETEVKGLQFLLPALARFARERRFRLELIGDGSMRKHYEVRARELGIEGSCRFRGVLPPQKMPERYREADFLVLSSLKETFGCVLIEAMASGLPVLATACGGPESLVTGETGLLVKPGSSEALLDGMREMARKLPEYEPAVLRAYADAHFGPKALARELKGIYRDALVR
ncbi:D-inositol 3-phosphate glycosyltransferase [Peptococcaceae bacterium CEB3]|nr:D-inositol 3-phosphate glycosyltransferase [Peptococcaceae bacterium CEB3]